MNIEGYTLPQGPVAEISGTIRALEKKLTDLKTTVGSEIPFLLMEAERNRAVMDALERAFNNNSGVTWLDFLDSIGDESRAEAMTKSLRVLLTAGDDAGRKAAANEVLEVMIENVRKASHEEPFVEKPAA